MIIMSFMLVWTSLTDGSTHTGTTYTECTSTVDTITKVKYSHTVGYRNVSVPVYHTDTIITPGDTVPYVMTDTVYQYFDLPLEVYKDSNYYLRTIGWLDSIYIENKVVHTVKTKMVTKPFSVYLTNHMGAGITAPGASVTWRRVHAGYNYDVNRKGGYLTLGVQLY
jgi:hypothetical protein